MDLYLGIAGERRGPYTVEQTKAMLAAGQVNLETLAWHEGLAGWVPLRTLPDFAVAGAAPAPAYTPPAPGTYYPQGGGVPGVVQPPKPTSQLAIASLICGVGSFMCCITFIPAIICGHMALNEIKRSEGRLDGKVPALIGTILGYVGLGVLVVYVVIIAIVGVSAAMHPNATMSP